MVIGLIFLFYTRCPKSLEVVSWFHNKYTDKIKNAKLLQTLSLAHFQNYLLQKPKLLIYLTAI